MRHAHLMDATKDGSWSLEFDLIWPWHVPLLRVLTVFKMFGCYPRQKYIIIWPWHAN